MGFRTKMFVELFNNYNIFFYLPLTSSHFHSLQVMNCDSNSRLVVDEGENGKIRLVRVKALKQFYINQKTNFKSL